MMSQSVDSVTDPAAFTVHPLGCCESRQVGRGTRIWAFAHVLPGAQIGENCNICDHVFIENDVVLGDRVTVKCGVQLWDHTTIESDVFIGPNATFTNDPFPRSKQQRAPLPRTVVARGASIGANATILPGLSIGQHAMVGAGAVVTRSVPPNAIVTGNPARITGYVDSQPLSAGTVAAEPVATPSPAAAVQASAVRGVTLHRLPLVHDLRGDLVVGEFGQHVPFAVKRFFMVFDVPSAETRGEHAHKVCQQFLVCVKGRVSVVADDGTNRQEFLLDRPDIGIYLPAGVWGIQYRYSSDALLLVFASEHYAADDYIRNYSEYLAYVAG